MSCTVLINSCDKYQACWEPMAYSLKKYWSDCPWPIKFITNHLDAPLGTIKVGDRTNWTESVRFALEQVKTEQVLWLLEDYWLTSYTDTRNLKSFSNLMKLGGGPDHIRLIPSKDIKEDYLFDSKLAVFKDDADYRCSLNAGLWYVPKFLNLLKEGEFIWDFEYQASIRSRGNDNFLCVKDFSYLHYIISDNPDGKWKNHAVDRGKWTEDAKIYAEQEGLNIDFSKNPREDLQ